MQRKEERKMQFHPEGHLIDTFENRAALQTPASLAEAMRDGKILEAKAVMCDSKHNLIVDLKFMRGLIPREEGALGIKDGTVRDIAILSRVNRPVCFLVEDFTRDEYGRITALLSRRAAQEKCREEFVRPPLPRRRDKRPHHPHRALRGVRGHWLRHCLTAAH